MKSYDVPEYSITERVDALLETVEKKVYEVTENINRVNEKLLPSIEENKQLAEETQPEQAKPSGWLEKKACHLVHIQNLLGQANAEIQRLKHTVIEKVPTKAALE